MCACTSYISVGSVKLFLLEVHRCPEGYTDQDRTEQGKADRAVSGSAGHDRTGQGGVETEQERLHANPGKGKVTTRAKQNSTCLCWLPISFYSTSAQRVQCHRRTCLLCHLQESSGRPFRRTSVCLLPLAPNSAAHTRGQGSDDS